MTNNSGVLMLLALLLYVAHGQSLTSYCGNNFRVISSDPALAFLAVTQFNNGSVATTPNNFIPCPDVRLAKTLYRSSNGNLISCDCPLIDHCTRIESKNNQIYPNPCFARCAYKDAGYGNYRKCQQKFFTSQSQSGSVAVSSTMYTNKTNCNACFSTINYTPVCVNGFEYSNLCFANCYQPNASVQACTSELIMTQESQNPANCVCVADVNPVCANGVRYMNQCLARCDHNSTTTTMTPC